MMFSVAMCLYAGDSLENFKRALGSVLSQTLQARQIVIVVDGPVPNDYLDFLEQISSEQNEVEIIHLPKNMGHGFARQKSLEQCRYDLVALMDSDDICLEERFALQVEFMKKNPDISVLGAQIMEFDESGDRTMRHVQIKNQDIIKSMKYRCPMNQMTVMFRKADVLNAGGYLDWFNNEDYYLWVRMHRAGALFHNLDKVLVRVRVDEKLYRRRRGWRYFLSEARLQLLMFNLHLITIPILCLNVLVRFIVQCLLPPALIQYVYKYLLRKPRLKYE
jgi:glycosyltransferase involved in cell wall biosynthesis